MARTVNFDEIEWAGAMAFRFLDVTIDEYTADGESFDEDAAGVSRLQRVIPQVVDGSGYRAEWNRNTQAIELYNSSGEAATDGTVTGIELEVTVIGRA